MRRIGPPVDQLSDEALLAGLGSGDRELTAAFVRRFQSKVYGTALAVLRDPEAAADVAQQAFERAWTHGHAFDPRRGTVGTWMATVTRNLAIDAARVRQPTPVDLEALLGVLGAGPSHPDDDVLAAQAAGELRAALRQLPPDQARAVVLAGLAGLPASEVAEREGIPLGTAKTRIRTALVRLRRALVETEAPDA